MAQKLSDTELLACLVGFDTTSSNSNLPLIDFVSDYLDRPGIRLTQNPSPDETKSNLVVELGPETGDERAGLMLSGHTDTVPAAEPEWHTPPHQLTALDGRLYGRGSSDMKGFVALAINTAATLDPNAMKAPLALVLTYDEEVGLLGAKQFAETWPESARLPKNAVIGEPTRLEVVRAHKGFVDIRFIFSGESAHSGYPHLGRNAIEPVGKAISALAELRRLLEAEGGPHAHEFPDVPYAPLNVGRVVGGVATNVVPDRCVLEVSTRPLPGMQPSDLAERIERAVRNAADGEPLAVETMSSSPPLLLALDAEVHIAALAAVGQTEDKTVSYATDGGWFQQMGFDCLIWGPGDIARAHKPNEFIGIDELQRGREVLDPFVRRFCF